MTLRGKILIYIIALHAVLAGAAFAFLLQDAMLLYVVEALFLVSVLISMRLVRVLFVPLDLIQAGAVLIAERDFTSRLAPVGQPELDTLIEVYNRMIDRLREERLSAEERHQLLQKIVTASPAGIVICDFDGRIEQMNPAAERVMTTELRAQLDAISAGQSRLLTHLGARRLKVSRAEFRDRGFAKTFFLVEEMTEELRVSEKSAYEKLIRMMSHEVNNSVGAVRSLLESSLSYAPQVGEADREDFTSALTIASARIDALNRFMSAFADVVRIPAPHPSRARVADLVKRVAGLLRPDLTQRGIRLELDLDRDECDFDVNQLEQVVLNIFRNAIDAIGRDGSLRATFHEGILKIADSGPGIAESIRSELFTPFFTTKRDGRGLGLTIVHDILANHGFPFALTNRPEGGAEFTIEFQ
jgi:signal transduction histidine kinase